MLSEVYTEQSDGRLVVVFEVIDYEESKVFLVLLLEAIILEVELVIFDCLVRDKLLYFLCISRIKVDTAILSLLASGYLCLVVSTYCKAIGRVKELEELRSQEGVRE